jgi:hypothetical protein
MAKFVGKNTRVKVGGIDLTASIASVTLNQTVNEVESTGFGSNSVQRIAGLQDASVTLEFHQDYGTGSVADTVGSVFGGTAEVRILAGTTLNQGTAATGAPLYTVSVLCSQQDLVNSQVGDISTFSVTWPAVGEVTKSTSGTF